MPFKNENSKTLPSTLGPSPAFPPQGVPSHHIMRLHQALHCNAMSLASFLRAEQHRMGLLLQTRVGACLSGCGVAALWLLWLLP